MNLSYHGGRPQRSRARRWLRRLVVLLIVVLVVVLLWYVLAGFLHGPKRVPPPPPGKPSTQSASCPDVQLLAVPGTWESSSNDDPHNPTFNPAALLRGVTGPLQRNFSPGRVDVYTVPYVAQFSNPIALPPDGQQSYNNSRTEGTQRAYDVLAQRYANCPLTTYVMVGFSQGAVIAGDLASQIAAGRGPIPADQVLGVTLIADGRRVSGPGPGQPIQIGADPGGVGAEVALAGIDVPGITMTGPRSGGFGSLATKTYSICAPGDIICAAPNQALLPANLLTSLGALIGSAGNPVHALYAGFQVAPDGTTTPQWTTSWATRLINSAPHPPHS